MSERLLDKEAKLALEFLNSCAKLKTSGQKYGQCNGMEFFSSNQVDHADEARMLMQVRPDLAQQIKDNCGVPVDSIPTRKSLGGQKRSIDESLVMVKGLRNVNQLLDSFIPNGSTDNTQSTSQNGNNEEVVDAEWDWAEDHSGVQIARYLGTGE